MNAPLTALLGIVCLILAITLLLVWRHQRALKRAAYIRSFALPPGLYERLRKHHPQLGLKECQLTAQALRQFFLAYLRGGHRFIAMPSQGADDLWHEFILYTKHYQTFCRHAFGRFLHHSPAVVLGGAARSNDGLRRCWQLVCREENINPRAPTRLPLLFALDTKLGIANGFRYVVDCQGLKREGDNGSRHCVAEFSDGVGEGGSDWFGGDGDFGTSGSDSGDGGGCGGGCGGD